MAGTKTASVGFLLGILVLLCVWASGARASTMIIAGPPDFFIVHCQSFAGETVRKDYGAFYMGAAALSRINPNAVHPIVSSFLLPDDPGVTRINCHFSYGLGSDAPTHQAFDVFTTGSSCPGPNPCEWYVGSDGFSYGTPGQLQFTYSWLPGVDPPSSSN